MMCSARAAWILLTESILPIETKSVFEITECRVSSPSSVMTGVGYDEEAQELDILFSSGNTYRYFGVPADVHAMLLEAESKGQFFNEEIKGAYRYAQVSKRRR